MLLLWFGGIVAILFLEQLFSLQTFHGWLAIAVFLLAFCLLAIKLQKLEIRK
jgi:hypothetical protein